MPLQLRDGIPRKIAFLHIDMNPSTSEIALLDALFDRVSTGGIILFDDYGWVGYTAQPIAEEAWMRERGRFILELPTGQGLVVKRGETGVAVPGQGPSPNQAEELRL